LTAGQEERGTSNGRKCFPHEIKSFVGRPPELEGCYKVFALLAGEIARLQVRALSLN
jgi:hypothetical protein